MAFPDLSSLTINDSDLLTQLPTLQDDIEHADDRYLQKLKNYAKSIPYAIESNARMQELLDFFLLRVTQCVEAKDDSGLLQWDGMLS